MPFLATNSQPAVAGIFEALNSEQEPKTLLRAKDGRTVFIIPDHWTLGELPIQPELRNCCQILPEADLSNILARESLRHLNYLRQELPGALPGQATLAPIGTRAISFAVNPESLSIAVGLIESIGGRVLEGESDEARGLFLIKPILTGDRTETVLAYIPKEELETILNRLSRLGIAGDSREAMILIAPDADA